jgi:ferredoxin
LRVEADREVCVGAGVCVRTAPGVFGQDEDLGLVALLTEWPEVGDAETVRQAVELCPSGALSIVEESAG